MKMNIGKKPEKSLPKESTESDRNTAMFDDILYDVYKLMHYAESMNEETVPIDSLARNKFGKYWRPIEGELFGAYHILSVTEKYHGQPEWDEIMKEHPEWVNIINRIRNANYQSYPILIVGKNSVIDGMKRLTKAWIDGVAEVKVKRFEELPEDARIWEGK